MLQNYNTSSDSGKSTKYNCSVELKVNKIKSAFAYSSSYVPVGDHAQHFKNSLSYNYELEIKDKIKIRLGIQGKKESSSFIDYYNSFSKLPNEMIKINYYSIDFGAWLNTRRFYIGLSTDNLFEPEWISANGLRFSTIRTYNLTVGHRFDANNFCFVPSILFAGLGFENKININTLIVYKKRFYGGFNYNFSNTSFIETPGLLGGIELFNSLQLMASFKYHKIPTYTIFGYGNRIYESEFGFVLKYKIGLDKKWF